MKKAINIEEQVALDVVTQTLTYTRNPTALFHTLCKDKSDCLLLESAEIDSKEDLKSLLLIDSALRITCNGRTVTFQALTENGRELISIVSRHITDLVDMTRDNNTLTLTFPEADESLDEDSRLRQASTFDALRLIQHSFDLTQHDQYAVFLGGLFAYDMVANFEPLGEVADNTGCPDYVFYVAETMMIIDHQAETSYLQGTLFGSQAQYHSVMEQRLEEIKQQAQGELTHQQAEILCDVPLSTNINDNDFCHIVSSLKEYIVNGDIFQVVPSRRFHLPCPSPLAAYEQLKVNNPSPYMFYLQDENFTLFGASPESALKYSKPTNEVQIYPIAGTRRRGKRADGSIDLDLDSRIELELRCDKKENAEHMMLVDLARNDVARISQAGTRHVADLLKVDRYSHVMHLVSRVVGQLRDDLDSLHAYQASMNMGTLTGAPKIRAMQLIREVEQERRGSYGGAVGYLTGHGDLDTCIVIRSAYVQNGIAQVQAGAGVVYDSDPQSEADETRTKAQAVITAIQQAHQA
ncbi:anthranilate synthase component 1 [Vibrio nitrifigilis]|uniref:Anthranilate synthase component 1 n=1 Tax=Vibrio nitrifigilis TaxID=2789781 RepID=A0ABS0GCD6_9VIBR|nr:anthranilate synthase component 1 [Vibrio nitrifigilis]MBF9000073.1 anthranilate synthase component 1 [Vibrio nitrifigilis]